MTSKSATNFRTTWVLLGAVAALLGGLAIYVFVSDETKPNTKGTLLETFQTLKINENDISGLEIDKGGEKIVFNRQADGRWRIVQPIQARADSDQIQAIVHEILEARRVEKGADLTSNLATHGLDKPAVKITLFKGDRSAWLALGKTTVGGDEAVVYVLTSDEPTKPQATRLKNLKDLFKEKPAENADTAALVLDLNDFRTKKLLGEGMSVESAPSQLRSIKLTEKTAKGERTVLFDRNSAKAWQFEIPAGYGDVLSDVPPEKRNPNTVYNLSSLLFDILSLEVPQSKDYLPESRDLAAVGLDPKSEGVLRIDIERDDPVGTETLWISRENVKSEKDKVYVRYEGDPWVAQINAEKPRMLRAFLENPGVLRDTTLVKLQQKLVDAVDITIDKNTFEIRKVEGKWKVKAGDKIYDGNAAAIDELIGQLAQPKQVRGFPLDNATNADLGLAPPQVQIKIWENGVDLLQIADPKAWPKVRETPTARIEFGRKEASDLVVARRYMGSNRFDALVPDSIVALALRGRLDYVDIGLTSFDPQKVEKISFLRDGETWEIERDISKQPPGTAEWKILAPESKKGQRANAQQIQLILESYKELKPEKVVFEHPSEDQLKALGLDPAKPVFKLVLKLKDPPAERIYYFGNQVNGKPSDYTKTSFCDYVFESPRTRVELVTKSRITDPILYRVELDKVRGMKLRGWVDAAKPSEPRVLDLERKAGGNWSAKNGQPIDNLKIEEFLMNVSMPATIEQVVEKTGPKPEQGLDVKQGALEVEIDVEGGKPITLTLGGLVNKESKKIYAMTNQLAGDVFTIDGERLLPVKEKMETLTAKILGGEKK